MATFRIKLLYKIIFPISIIKDIVLVIKEKLMSGSRWTALYNHYSLNTSGQISIAKKLYFNPEL